MLALLLVLALAQDPVPALIEKLDSEEIADREAAQKELARIGRKALPAVEAASAAAKGERKLRLQRIVERITAYGTPPLVTLDASDRPLREIAGELQRQTGIPVRASGAVAEVKASVSAKGAILWKAIEDLCRARGDLMYRFTTDAVEIHSGKFRALPSADLDGLRVFIDRFQWTRDQPPHGSGQFKMQSGVLTPAGARVVWMHVVVDELRDDKGVDLTPYHEMEMIQDGDRYGLHSKRILFPQTYRPPRGAPSEDSATLRCRGKAVVLLAGGERVLGRVTDPLSRPTSRAPEGLPTFGLEGWRRQDGYLSFSFTAGWESESVKSLTYRVAPLLVIRLRNGDWIPTYSEHYFHPHTEAVKRHSNSVWAEMPEAAEIESLDLVVPDPVIRVEIPFDFRDIPLK